MNIDFDLEDIPGIIAAQTSYAKQESNVTYDESLTIVETIIATIGKLGYRAQVKE